MGVINLVGVQFYHLKVIERVENCRNGSAQWRCKCSCGNTKIVIGCHLRSGNTKSCGCLISKGNNLKHGMCYSKTYGIWQGMISRCTNKKAANWYWYGGRGITVCKRWYKFENFYADMGNAPDGLTIDRIDNNKGYYKKNCRWTTAKQNSRNNSGNRLLVFKGKTKCITEWSEILGINLMTLYWRLNFGWSVKRALTEHVRKYKTRI